MLWVLAAVIAVPTVLGLGSCFVCTLAGAAVSSSTPPATAGPKKPHVPSHLRPRTSLDAWMKARGFVEASLTVPDSADFGSIFSQDSESACKDLGNHEWECSSWVKAQNAFGVTLKNNFRVRMRYLRDNNETWIATEGPVFR